MGETQAERRETLAAIAEVHARYGHIQEAIVQPYNHGSQQSGGEASVPLAEFLDTVAIARQMLPDDITIQVPPNLIATDPALGLLPSLKRGARDLGGLGPVDEVNPDFPHPTPAALRTLLHPQGYALRMRLPIYSRYMDWVPKRVKGVLQHWQARRQEAVSG